ncbi:DHH family phosphoesterase [Geomesophilobacter sediminis]|uniref:Bifunctional oligoribonuclease/PAP phosphatase NrnA n=1 Tax=Geomesophilobacter sediminis TaxID=2798584 RepID=A0A8J7M1H8_9BACT|nr:bifunctional oligoribonuclease/PAP phosphatase NrnA [Geomesophilobacter sediminis]MBJ6726748.1 bifunctional oligoribonuclease/PAP phosphatase NrnA [Geomesophilobacter sediminis]
MMATLSEIRTVIDRHTTFLVTTHEGPDGDAVGSSLALAHYLKSLGKDASVYICDPVPDAYAWLPMADQVLGTLPDRDYEVCFVLDVGEFKRTGKEITSSTRIGSFVNIDHHPDCPQFGALNLIDPQACATGAIIYRLIKESGATPDYATSLCIYTAIVTDTGRFSYSNANPEAFAITGELVTQGVNTWDVTEKLFESQPKARLDLLALALADLTVSPCGEYGSLSVTLDMYEKTGGTAELTDGFVNYPRSIRGVEVAIFFRELAPREFKVGFRSKGKVDVGAISAHFGGGGHHNAAGCKVNGTLDEVKDLVFAKLRQTR